jgi:hypothetical protein
MDPRRAARDGGALAAIARLPANPIGAALWPRVAIYCIASATQDIAIDGYTIGLVDRGARVPRTRAHDRLSRSGSRSRAAACCCCPRGSAGARRSSSPRR